MKSVDQIITRFLKTATELEGVADAMDVRAEKSFAQAERLASAAEQDLVEVNRARAISAKLRELVEV